MKLTKSRLQKLIQEELGKLSEDETQTQDEVETIYNYLKTGGEAGSNSPEEIAKVLNPLLTTNASLILDNRAQKTLSDVRQLAIRERGPFEGSEEDLEPGPNQF